MQTPRRAATAGLAVLAVTAVAAAAALGVLAAPVVRVGAAVPAVAAAPADQFRIVTDLGACGDVHNEIAVANHPKINPSVLYLYKSVLPGLPRRDAQHDDEPRWSMGFLNEDGSLNDLAPLTATIRRWRTNGEHVDLKIGPDLTFEVVEELLAAVRAAGVRCVFLADVRHYAYCSTATAPRRPCRMEP